MPNYFTTVNPYFAQPDQSGLMPVFQNIGQQQANQNAALQQQLQNNQAAGQAFQQGGSGMNPLAMAAMLRKKEPGTGQMYDANGKIVNDPTYGAGTAYGNMTSGEIANMQQYGV